MVNAGVGLLTTLAVVVNVSSQPEAETDLWNTRYDFTVAYTWSIESKVLVVPSPKFQECVSLSAFVQAAFCVKWNLFPLKHWIAFSGFILASGFGLTTIFLWNESAQP